MLPYFERLTHDMSALGADGLQPLNHKKYRDVYLFMHHAGEVFWNPSKLAADRSTKLKTTLGKTILNLMEQNRGFTKLRWYEFCADSEPRLLKNIANTGDTSRQQPVIITHQDVPIALLKTTGDRTVYGIQTVPHYGIAAGCFSVAKTRTKFDPNILDTSSLAWKIDIDAIDPLYPTRPSMFTVPLRERRGLQTDFPAEALTLQVSHKYIVKRAQELATTAIALPE